MNFIHFLFENRRWLLGTILLMLASYAGQTHVVAQYSSEIRTELGLGHGSFGFVYTIGTLTSAATLIWVGKIVDFHRPVVVGMVSILLLAGFSLIMAATPNVWILAFAIFGLRLFGQSMLPHTAITAIGRWYKLRRGKAIAIASLGMVFGEAFLPITVASTMALIGWRQTWVLTALVLVCVLLPVIWLLLRIDRSPQSTWDQGESKLQKDIPDWTRPQVLADWRFWILWLGLMAYPFILTGIIFHQVHFAESKNWEMQVILASYPVLAFSGAVFSFLAGVIIDRIGAAKTIMPAILFLGIGVAVLGTANSPVFVPVAFLLIGAGGGSMNTINGAIWPELYGLKHLGSIRAVASAGMTFSTALSPGLMGWLIDLNISIAHQFLIASCYCFVISIVFLILTPYFIPKEPNSNRLNTATS